MRRQELERLNREQLIAEAERLGVPRPRVLTQPELVDEIITRSTKNERERARARGWLGRARDLLARVVEKGLHLPDAARAIRSTGEERSWPAPPPPLPTVTLAEIYAAQGHLERAIAVLDEVLAREPDHAEATQLRARFVEQSRARARSGKGAPPVVEESVTDEATSGEETEAGTATPSGEAANSGASVESAMAEEKDAEKDGEGAVAASEPAVSSGQSAGEEIVGAQTKSAGEAVEEAPAAATATESETASAAEASAEAVSADAASAETASVTTERAAASGAEEPSTPEASGEPELPERYDVDEIVAIAVDPRTIYLYWEVRATTLARAQARRPEGFLGVRVASVTASWDGPLVSIRDLRVDSLFGDRFIRDVQPGANVRVSVGWEANGEFEPFAVGIEVTAPHLSPMAEVAGDVARWTPDARAPVQPRHSGALAGAMPHSAPPVHFGHQEPDDRGAGAIVPPRAPEPQQPAARTAQPVWTGPTGWIPRGRGHEPTIVSWNEQSWVTHRQEIVREGSWFQPGGASELGRGGPLYWFGGASELGRGGASELGRGGASELGRG